MKESLRQKTGIKEVNRNNILVYFEKTPPESKVLEQVKNEFARQIELLSTGAKDYYFSQPAFKAELLRSYLIAIIDGDQALEDYFGKDIQIQIQAAYDIAFLREMMVILKSRSFEMTEEYKRNIFKNSNMETFRANLNNQEKWIALLNVMKG